MANQNFPFFDPKNFADMKIPGIDIDAVIASQKKNLEAATQASAVAFEGFQTVMRRQAELFQQYLKEAQIVAQTAFDTTAPEEKLVRQTDQIRSAYEQALTNLKELSELLQKTGGDAAQVINGRIAEAMTEFKHAVRQAGDKVQTGQTQTAQTQDFRPQGKPTKAA